MQSIPYGRQSVTQEDIDSVVEVLKGDWLTQGPTVREFEEAFARAVHAPLATAVSSGTAGLHLAVESLLQSGKKVLTTPITFAATANSILYCGGIPVFVDIDPETMCICPVSARTVLEQSADDVDGIIAVSFAGYPAPLQELRNLCDEFGLWLVEDACHAPGAYKSVGSQQLFSGACDVADAAVFSFHPVKHIAMGEGGVVTTRDKTLYEKHQRMRTHGIEAGTHHDEPWRYEMPDLGFNYRITDIQSALGLSQLSRLHDSVGKRQRIARKYTEALSTYVQCPTVPDSVCHAFHLYVIQTEKRRELYEYLHKKNIKVQVHYVPTYYLDYYRQNGYAETTCPRAERYYQHCLSLPMYPTLTDSDQRYVIETIQGFFEQ